MKSPLENFISVSARMLEIKELIKKVTDLPVNVLLTGESGTGKNFIARAIHDSGERRNGPFVEIDCPNLSEGLMASELFGHEKGSFSGALESRPGKFEIANGGTIFIDQVSELDLALQAKLLRIIQERSFERIGGHKTISVDVRIIASSSIPLEGLVQSQQFRKDLFFRLNVVRIEIPPLRERKEDIAPLAEYFLEKYRRLYKTEKKNLSYDAKQLLLGYHWPGNVRELENHLERAVLFSSRNIIEAGEIPIRSYPTKEERLRYAADNLLSLEEFEKAYIREILRITGGRISKAADILKIHRKTLWEKRKKYGLT